MSNPVSDSLENVGSAERSLLDALKERAGRVPPDPNELTTTKRTFGERVADRVATALGSWTFILCFVAALGTWIAWNYANGSAAYDPFPFILLNLLLSCVAAIQAPVIMMSQNRQATRDRLHAELDYQVNVKAELEVAQLRTELEELRREQWSALLSAQRSQTELLQQIATNRLPKGSEPAIQAARAARASAPGRTSISSPNSCSWRPSRSAERHASERKSCPANASSSSKWLSPGPWRLVRIPSTRSRSYAGPIRSDVVPESGPRAALSSARTTLVPTAITRRARVAARNVASGTS